MTERVTPPAETARPGHDAFISYNWASSRSAARKLQSALESIWRATRLDPAMRIFRDETGQQFGGLSSTLKANLLRSRNLLVLVHARTVESEWMDFEIREWLANGGEIDRLILVRIDPSVDLTWDSTTDSFACPDQLLPALVEAYREVPLYVDLRISRLGRVRDPSLELPRLCAFLMRRDPAEVLQRALRIQRRQQRRSIAIGSVLAILAVLAVLASIGAIRSERVADLQRDEAVTQRTEAEAQALAAEAMLGATTRPDQSIQLLQEAAARSDNRSVRLAIYSVINENPRLVHLIDTGPVGGAPDDLVFDRPGSLLAGWRAEGDGDGSLMGIWSAETGKIVAQGRVPGPPITDVELVAPGTAAVCREDGATVVTWAIAAGDSLEVREVSKGHDECRLGPLSVGAAFINIDRDDTDGADSRAAIALVDRGGRVTELGETKFAAIDPELDRVLSEPTTGPFLLADATGRVEEVSGTADDDISQPLSSSSRGGFILTTDRAGPVVLDHLRPEAGVRSLPVPPDASSVVLLDDGTSVWVDRNGTLGWSRDDTRISLTPQSPRVQPAMWLLDSGRIVVDLFDSAVGIATEDTQGRPRLRRTGRVEVDTIFSERAGTAGTLQVGRYGILLPESSERMNYFDGVEAVTLAGTPFFDASGTTAVSFDSGSVSSYSLGEYTSDEPLALDRSGATIAADVMDGGRAVAVSRAGSPIAIYRTDTTSATPTLVSERTELWTTGETAAGVTYRALNGSDVVRVSTNGDRTAYPELDGRIVGWFTHSPSGSEVVLKATDEIEGGASAVDSEANVVVVDGDGNVSAVSTCSPGEGRIRYLPGAGFRTSSDEARTATLVQVRSEADQVQPCRDGAQATSPADAEVADPADVLDYQARGDEVLVLARAEEGGGIELVRSTGTGPPEVSPLPGTDASSRAFLRPAGGDVLVLGASGALTWLKPADDGWRIAGSAVTGLEEVGWASLEPSSGVAVIAGVGGRLEIIDFTTGRIVLGVGTEEVAGSDGVQRPVADGTLSYQDGHIEISLWRADADGLIAASETTSIPWRLDLLREELCRIAPREAPLC